MNNLAEIMLLGGIPGAAGGLAYFLLGIHRGYIRGGKFARKAFLEIVGGALVGLFIAYPLAQIFFERKMVLALVCFLFGVSWSQIVQALRWSTTNFVRKKLEDWKEPGE